MLRKFIEGLVFGAGFTIAAIVIGVIGATTYFSTLPISHRSGESADEGNTRPFHELSIDEQIEAASVIAVARFEPAEDGRMKAVLTELLKKNEGTRFHYDIGDEYSHASYYPNERRPAYGDGVVIFFEGSPAMMRSSMSYSGDRIGALGDMPLKVLRNKCGPDATDGSKTPAA